MAGLLDDVGVDHRGLAAVEAVVVLFVQAPGRERVAGEVEVEAGTEVGEVGGGRAARHRRVAVAELAQGDLRVVEDPIDAHRGERLAVLVAGGGLGPEHDDRGVPIGERLGVVDRLGRRRPAAGQHADERDAPARHRRRLAALDGIARPPCLLDGRALAARRPRRGSR